MSATTRLKLMFFGGTVVFGLGLMLCGLVFTSERATLFGLWGLLAPFDDKKQLIFWLGGIAGLLWACLCGMLSVNLPSGFKKGLRISLMSGAGLAFLWALLLVFIGINFSGVYLERSLGFDFSLTLLTILPNCLLAGLFISLICSAVLLMLHKRRLAVIFAGILTILLSTPVVVLFFLFIKQMPFALLYAILAPLALLSFSACVLTVSYKTVSHETEKPR